MSKVKILFLAANPTSTDPLRLDKEISEVTAKIRASEYRDSLELVSRWGVRPDDLQQVLLEVKPHVVHFSGHGNTFAELILLDDRGHQNPVDIATLSRLFRALKDDIRVVVFNACYSLPQAEAIASIIECTVGMNQTFGDEAAVRFAASFYRAIGFGRSIQTAFDLGLVALTSKNNSQDKTPELRTRPGVDASTVVLIPLPAGHRFSSVPYSHPLVPTDGDRIEVLEGIEFFIRDAKGKGIRVGWDLPPISKRTGIKSALHIMHWKQLHKISGRAYYSYYKMTTCIYMSIMFINSNNLNESELYRKQAYQFLEIVRINNKQFCSSLNEFPKDVREIRMLRVLRQVDTFCSAIQHAISSPASSPSFHKGLVLSERICEWLFESLHRADALLEVYLQGQSDGAE